MITAGFIPLHRVTARAVTESACQAGPLPHQEMCMQSYQRTHASSVLQYHIFSRMSYVPAAAEASPAAAL
jgi:hypothetical protein